jgi:hypothetical protein
VEGVEEGAGDGGAGVWEELGELVLEDLVEGLHRKVLIILIQFLYDWGTAGEYI